MSEPSSPIKLSGSSVLSVSPLNTSSNENPVAEELSGIAINQNGASTGNLPFEADKPVWQTFRFPADYPRGDSETKIAVPWLSGFQVNLTVAPERGPSAGIDWMIDHYHPYKGWQGVAKGTAVGAPGEGSVWFNVSFDPVDITDFWWHKFRIGIIAHNSQDPVFRKLVPYDRDKNTITIEDQVILVVPNISPAPLRDGKRYTFELEEGRAAILEVMSEDIYFSDQHGIEGVNYTSPNPYSGSASVEYITVDAKSNSDALEEFERIRKQSNFATPATIETGTVTIPRVTGSDIKTYIEDGVNPYLSVGEEVALRFRILTSAPDVDRDCTGSLYRTITSVSSPESVRTSVGDLKDAYWISAPNPSRFACEALYIDARDGAGDAQVVDHILIDPITPGVYMNIYYSNDPSPGTDTDSWDGLLWTRVDKQFLLRRRETFALPEPMTAKYIKLEFTHLQPMWYAPGTFRLPTQYRKHPKWVMDYYLLLYQHERAQEIEAAPTVNVSFDALDLAYNYYLDDIRQDEPNPPTTVTSAEGVSLLTRALIEEQKAEEGRVDATTLQKINLSMQRFTRQPSQQGHFESLLQTVVSQTSKQSNYPVEVPTSIGANTTEVSSLERDSVIVEKQFPVTSFYLTCRHYYMISEASFQEDRAYFAGIKEVALTREHYESKFDTELYIETAGDEANIEINDLFSVDHTWVTYSETD